MRRQHEMVGRFAVGVAALAALALGVWGCSSGGSSSEGDGSAAASADAAGAGAADAAAQDASGTAQDTATVDAAGGADSGGTGQGTDAGNRGGPDVVQDPKCGIPPGYACNPLCNTGCDEGQTCLFVDGAWKCDKAGDRAPGDECDHPTGCAAGGCLVPADGIPRCFPPCLDDGDCPEGLVCNVQDSQSTAFKFCGAPPPPCNPFDQAACDAGQACYLNGSDTQCLPAGDAGAGDPCSQPNSCGPGLACVTVAGQSNCARMCSTDPANSGEAFACAALCGAGNFQQMDVDTKTGICTNDVQIPTCDPVAQDCDAGKACYFTDGAWVCMPEGNKEEGQSCSAPSECQKGLTCHQSGKCKVICDAGQPKNNPACDSPDISCVPLGGSGGYCDQ